MPILLKTLAFAVALFALDRLFLWMEGRGWIYYRRRKPSGGALGNALMEIHALLEPEKHHVVEIREETVTEREDSGDPPKAEGGLE